MREKIRIISLVIRIVIVWVDMFFYFFNKIFYMLLKVIFKVINIYYEKVSSIGFLVRKFLFIFKLKNCIYYSIFVKV